MKILYLENNYDLDDFINKINDLHSDDALNSSTFTGYDFDHVLVNILSFEKIVKEFSKNTIDLFFDQGSLKIYKNLNKVILDDKDIYLSKKEYDLLVLLSSNYPRLVSKEVLALKIWRNRSDYMSNTLEVHLNKLRKKLGKNHIICVKGFGYRLNID